MSAMTTSMASLQWENEFMLSSRVVVTVESTWLQVIEMVNSSLRLRLKGCVIEQSLNLWLEICLIPVLQPGEWVVLDNATFHHGGRIAELIQAKGAEVAYLPLYSPDLNRIEECWAWLKGHIRKQRRNATSLSEAIEAVLKHAAS